MNDETRKELHKRMGWEWHERNPQSILATHCVCGVVFHYDEMRLEKHINASNHPLNTKSDLMALYRRIYETGRWEKFEWFAYEKFRPKWRIAEFIAWLFCLSGEGYEERCEMVASFIKEPKP